VRRRCGAAVEPLWKPLWMMLMVRLWARQLAGDPRLPCERKHAPHVDGTRGGTRGNVVIDHEWAMHNLGRYVMPMMHVRRESR